MASEFVELAHRKLRDDGTLAMVLPLSAMSGTSWNAIRTRWRDSYGNIMVISVAGAGTYDSSFSADTGMAECLLVAKRDTGPVAKEIDSKKRATFVILSRPIQSTGTAELLSAEINRLRETGAVGKLEGMGGSTPLMLGDDSVGVVIDAPLPESGPWQLSGIADGDLAKAAYHLVQGSLMQLGQPGAPHIDLPIVRLGKIAIRGPVDRDITGNNADGTPRGPFELIKPAVSAVPTYPMLWAHNAMRERELIVEPDSEGRIKASSGRVTGDELLDKAADVWKTATRSHYNRDLRFNSQSLIVAFTERPCIGGMAWPSVIFENQDHEYVFSLWCNSTLGLLLHWWVANKTQSGRGRTTVTGIPNIPTLDVTTLTGEQIAEAMAAFEEMRGRRFLPFDQIDEDPSRAELDRRLLVDVLGLPESLVEPDGPIDLLRRKLAREPQVHGGKKTRVVFCEGGREGKEGRGDR